MEEDSTLTEAKNTTLTDKRIEMKELIKQPSTLTDATYLLLSLNSHNISEIASRLSLFIKNREIGQVTEEDKTVIEQMRAAHLQKYNQFRSEQLNAQHRKFDQEGALAEESENIEDLYCVHCTNHPPSVEEGKAIINTTFLGSEGKHFRTTVHFSLNHPVAPVSGVGKSSSWGQKDYVVISSLKGLTELNGTPYGMLPEDTWWAPGIEEGLRLPPGTKIIAKRGNIGLGQLRNMAGIEVIEVEGLPHTLAENIMQEKGMKVISPRSFKGAKKIADQMGAFYGYHIGSLLRYGSASYIRAEGVIDSAADDKEQVKKIIDKFNQGKDSPFKDWAKSNNWHFLAELTFLDYFSQEDFPDIPFAHPQNGHQVSFAEVVSAMKSHYWNSRHYENPKDRDRLDLHYILEHDPGFHERMVAWVGLNILTKLLKMGDTIDALPVMSKRMIQERIGRVKDNLDIIPPQLIGGFLAKNFEYLFEY